MVRQRYSKRRMARRYSKRKESQAPKPSAIWGAWGAVLKPDARPVDINRFIEECIFASVENVVFSFKEEGYDGTCVDFILDNREKMARILAKIQKAPGEALTNEDKVNIKAQADQIVTILLKGGTGGFSVAMPVPWVKPTCLDNGSPIPCMGKILDSAYEKMAEENPTGYTELLRKATIDIISRSEVNLAAPLCKTDGQPIACMQKVIDDPGSLAGLESKMAFGQSIRPALEAKCVLKGSVRERAGEVIEIPPHETSCMDKVIDNLIKYGSNPPKPGDPPTVSENYQKHKAYNDFLKVVMAKPSLTGIKQLLGENIFYDENADARVSGYDKIIRRTGDHKAYREFMHDIVDNMLSFDVFDFPRMASDPTLCNHPFLDTPTACIDTLFALMNDRKPGSPYAERYPRASALRYSDFEKILVAMAYDIHLEEHTCIPIPQAGQPWKDERVNCLSNIFAMPSAGLSKSVFTDAPERMKAIHDQPCRYAKPDGTSVDIPCFEAILRDVVTKPGEYDAEEVIKSIIPTGADLSKKCNNLPFSKITSCLDLLMDLDRSNAMITEYFNEVSDDPKRSADLFNKGKMECTIRRTEDKQNLGNSQGMEGREFLDFLQRLEAPDRPADISVSCFDKMLVKMAAQTGLPHGYGDAISRKPDRYDHEDVPPKHPNYLVTGLNVLTGTPVGMDANSKCRFIYADADRRPAEIMIPCYQKYLEAIMPLSITTPRGELDESNAGSFDEFMHEVFTTFDFSKNCISTTPGSPHNEVPCLQAMIAKYGVNEVFNLDSSGSTKMRDRRGTYDDVRCSLIGSRHFGKVLNTLPGAKNILCQSIKCTSKLDSVGIDTRVKGKIEKIKYCNCDMPVDGTFSPDDATCFEESCYKTLAKFVTRRETDPAYVYEELREYYRAGGAMTPPIVKYIQESMPPNKQIVDDISGVYEVKTRMSPYDFHVRRYIVEFARMADKARGLFHDFNVERDITTIDTRKLMEMTGNPILEEAILAAQNMSREQKESLNATKKKIRLYPDVSIHFKKGNEMIEIPPDMLEKAATIRTFVGDEGMTEAYSKRPEWIDNIDQNYVAAIEAITAIAKAYVESDDKNIYYQVDYTDEDNNPVYDYNIQELLPPRASEGGIDLDRNQKAALKAAGEITLPDGRVIKMRYNLFANRVRTSKRFSQLASLPNIPAQSRREFAAASKLAAGLPETPMYVVITTDPRDVMRASTCQNWGSCLKLEDGGGGQQGSLSTYIKGGSYIAYITDDINNPVWKGRLLMHRSANPKLLAMQDRWFRDCAVEWIYGLPEFRRLLLDTVRTVLYDKGYNRESTRRRYDDVPPYLMKDYHENPIPYLVNDPGYKTECAAYIAGKVANARWLEDEFIKDTIHYDDAWWDAFAQDHGFPWATRYEELTRPIRDAVSAGVISDADVNQYDGRIKTSLKKEVVAAFRDEFIRIWAGVHPCDALSAPTGQAQWASEWGVYVKELIDRKKRGVSSAQPILPIAVSMHTPWLDVDTTYGGNSAMCGKRQEFRVISDSEVAEIRKYRGDDFIVRLSDYRRTYPSRPVEAP